MQIMRDSGFVGEELEAEDAAEMIGVVGDEGFLLVDGAGGNEDIGIGKKLAGGAEGTADPAGLDGFGKVNGDAVKSGEKRELAGEVGVGKPFEVFHGGDGGDAHGQAGVLLQKAVAGAGLAPFPLPLEVDQEGGIKMHGYDPRGMEKLWDSGGLRGGSFPSG
jgi:hypothetical protein